jgi:hypothetical protein
VVIVGALAAQFIDERRLVPAERELTRLHPLAQGAMLATGLLVIDVLGPEGVAPFIYFQF